MVGSFQPPCFGGRASCASSTTSVPLDWAKVCSDMEIAATACTDPARGSVSGLTSWT